MRIMHNIPAMNTLRNKSKISRAMSKNMEKLSSGYRINRAGDDAAGLAISEKMRAQITGLGAAERNVQDGISLIKTAEGSMQEIQDMLHRLGYLSTQAANGTYSEQERQAMQDEVDQILREIQRIKDTSNFNGIPLLQGDEGTVTTAPTYTGGLPAWVENAAGTTQEPFMSGTYTTQETYTDSNGATGTADIQHSAAFVDFSGLNSGNINELLGTDTGFYTTCCTCDSHYSIKFTNGSGDKKVDSGTHHIYEVDIGSLLTNQTVTGSDLVDRIIDSINGAAGQSVANPNNHYTKLTKDPTNPDVLVVYDNRAISGDPEYDAVENSGGTWTGWTGLGNGDSTAAPTATSGDGYFGKGVAYDSSTVEVGDIVLQIGDSAAETMAVDLPNMALGKIGVTGLSVTTIPNANAAIGRIKQGVNYVSGERARMGAYQNRLEHTAQNLSVMKENIQNAESLIRDTDIADEMTSFTKNSILSQSAQAMLSQANQTPQGVLQLMR